MSKELRIIGKNIELAVKKTYANSEKFKKDLGLSDRDMERLFTGRLLIGPSKIKQIAKLTNVTVTELLNTDKDYSFVHSYGQFLNKENEHKILDFIDDYIDLIEFV